MNKQLISLMNSLCNEYDKESINWNALNIDSYFKQATTVCFCGCIKCRHILEIVIDSHRRKGKDKKIVYPLIQMAKTEISEMNNIMTVKKSYSVSQNKKNSSWPVL